jgi:hypothetical protein
VNLDFEDRLKLFHLVLDKLKAPYPTGTVQTENNTGFIPVHVYKKRLNEVCGPF